MASSISSGFREDCSEFLCDFAKLKATDYQTFSQEWKRTNFQYIFFGRNTDAEMAEYLGEIFYTVKKMFIVSNNPFERIGSFYLLYTLYFKQPLFMFCKIRLTLTEWRMMKTFAKYPYNEKELPQITVILWKMFKSDAFRFVQDELERGFDRFYLKSFGTSYDSSSSYRTIRDLEKELQTLTAPNGLINAMEILEMGYNEMKEALDDNGVTTVEAIIEDKIPQSSLIRTMHHDLDLFKRMLYNNNNETQSSSRIDANVVKNDNDPVGAKRYALRRKAYKREIKKKMFRIAGKASPHFSEESDDQVSSSTLEKLTTRNHQKENDFEASAIRNIRHSMLKLSDHKTDNS
ncbi:uncharacterized protein LOC121601066 isoform X2 [Anopheles merus]|uniref:uncharacterized protein LOC121601066 isoform X2 n=1 Tax=Anopheles merus TaxID=30066 RepID=UPI001BE418FA|nr:uncharacterized protein LOC121601066 isoform X2 [Anopheles merus]